jgi:hypothetical protein
MADVREQTSSPSIGDFSRKATQKAVLSNTLQHPLTLFPIAIGVLGTLGIVLFQAPVLAVGAALGGFGIGVGSWIVNYLVRNKTWANRYVESLHKKIEAQKSAALEKIEQDLIHSQTVKGTEQFAEQGTAQFKMIQDCFENLRSILGEKLNAGELTYSRYLGTAEQVYLSVLDNLQNIATLLKSIRTIDRDYIEDRMSSMKALKKLTAADEQEMETLEKRAQLRDEQLKKIDTLLAHNEKALTELDQTTTSIASVQTSQGRAKVDLESAMKDLEELAKRSQRYSI